MYEHEPSVGMEVVIDIIENLHSFHAEVLEKVMSTGKDVNPEVAAAWHRDMVQLENASMLLKSIKL